MTRILVIEDEADLREGIRDILTDIGGYEVLLAKDGRIGVDLAVGQQPDLILCDVGLPELDGYAVLATLQKNPQTAVIPFIFVTAKGERKDNRLGMELGADDYIVKPFDYNELLAAIQTRLAKQETIASQYEAQMDLLRGNLLLALPHELRTPLASIVGYAELIGNEGEKLPRDQIKFMAKHIEEAGNRLRNLIENYLIYAQLALIQSDPEHVRLLRAVAEAQPDTLIGMLVYERKMGGERVIHTNLQVPDLLLPMRNENFLKILQELLSNGLKFSPPDTAVFISTAQIDNDFLLTIVNKGRGFLPEQIKQIGLYMQFERNVHEQQGSGMGLMIVQILTALHGGVFSIDSDPGKETAVTVRIPL